MLRNQQDLESVVLDARVGDEPVQLDLTTTVMGLPLAMPLMMAPIGAQCIRPGAETLAARAAAGAGIAYSLSEVASQSIEEVLPQNPNTLAQLFWAGARSQIQERIHRYREAGATGLIVTLDVTMDWSLGAAPDWPVAAVPTQVDFRTMAKFAPHVVRHPFWLLEFLRHRELPTLDVPQFATKDNPRVSMLQAIQSIDTTPQPSWQDIAWIRQEWDGPLMIKGITHPDDARRAADLGANAVAVSNHGGNTLDDKQSTISALPRVVEAVGGAIDVVMDGGVYRGADVVKVLGYGGKAAMIGRGYLWPLISRGEAGVSEILDIYRAGVEHALRTLKEPSVRDVGSHHVIAPGDPRLALAPRLPASLLEAARHANRDG